MLRVVYSFEEPQGNWKQCRRGRGEPPTERGGRVTPADSYKGNGTVAAAEEEQIKSALEWKATSLMRYR